MLEFLPEDIRRGIDSARIKAERRGSRLCVHVGEAIFPLLRLWDGGFAVDTKRVPKLRGLVDVYDGPRHISQCLIIAASEDAGEMSYEFKRETIITQNPIRDYVEDRVLPDGYLPRPT